MKKVFRVFSNPRYVFKCICSNLRYRFRAKEFHYNNYIDSPLELLGIKNISLGKGSFVKKNAYINVLPLTGESKVEFVMGDYSHLNFGAHIIATKSIVIGNSCNIAPYVYIADNTHSYKDLTIPIKFSPIKQLRTVTIGDGTWIGTRAVIIGCSIGKHCVIGANSVVKHDIPDYCVASGIPARIIMRYNFEKKAWRKTDPEGNFL